MWLAAEHGMFLRRTTGDWMTTMPENLNMDWVDSVKVRTEKSRIRVYNITVEPLYVDFEFLFSMCSNISPRGHHDLISSFVKLHLYGIISTQVVYLIHMIELFS